MSSWYNMPIEVQKMFYVMQIRCKKPCSLTACGLYEMNMENFGTVCIAIYKFLIIYILTNINNHLYLFRGSKNMHVIHHYDIVAEIILSVKHQIICRFNKKF